MRMLTLAHAAVVTLALAGLPQAAAGQVFYVNCAASSNGIGSAASPFNDIKTGIDRGNNYPGAVIYVAPGVCEATSTLQVKTSLILTGSNVPVVDPSGLPTGAVVQNTETKIVAGGALATDPLMSLMSVGKDVGVLYNVSLNKLTFVAGAGAVLEFRRTQNFVLRNSIFLGAGAEQATDAPGVSTFASTGVIQANYVSRLLFGASITGGYSASPASVVLQQNRLEGNKNGLLLVGTSDGITEPGNVLTTVVTGNDLSHNLFTNPQGVNSGFGLRVMIKGNEALGGSAGLSKGYVTAVMQSNTINQNYVGIVLDAGFPYRKLPDGTCEPRDFSGALNLTFRANAMSGNENVPLISFTRMQVTLGSQAPSRWQYLKGTTFSIVDDRNLFGAAQLVHPLTDPVTDCNDGALVNLLRINGLPVN